ncbi:MAG: LysR family transcriptional regulator [Hyphomicrobiales bacterium]|nr:LysR family transcriptional regulator [Hyphomicrobiales bacterium]MCP5001469.1 LysR family transcriptional regulator [Hyphomicrobiales bacterium]
MDWDIFRLVVAVADGGSAVAASERLGVNASTVLRRISRFEQENGVRLFERRQTGYTPTAECEAVIETAREIEQSIAGIGRDLLGRDLRLEGRLAVTTTDSLLNSVVAPLLLEFSTLHPQIKIDVSVTNSRLNLTRQDADIAVRTSKMPPETLVGQRVSGLAFAVYATPSVVAQLPAGKISRLRRAPWVGIGSALTASPVGSWMDRHVPAERIAVTADTFVAVHDCAATGAGLAVLPCCLGDQSRHVVRVTPPVDEMETSLWVLTHSDIRSAARVKAFNEFMSRELRNMAGLIEGRVPA